MYIFKLYDFKINCKFNVFVKYGLDYLNCIFIFYCFDGEMLGLVVD